MPTHQTFSSKASPRIPARWQWRTGQTADSKALLCSASAPSKNPHSPACQPVPILCEDETLQKTACLTSLLQGIADQPDHKLDKLSGIHAKTSFHFCKISDCHDFPVRPFPSVTCSKVSVFCSIARDECIVLIRFSLRRIGFGRIASYVVIVPI